MFLKICITKPNNNFAFIRINEANSNSNVQNFLPVSYRCKLCTHHLILKPDCPYTCIRCIKKQLYLPPSQFRQWHFFYIKLVIYTQIVFSSDFLFLTHTNTIKISWSSEIQSNTQSQLCLTHKSPPPAVRTSLWQFKMEWQSVWIINLHTPPPESCTFTGHSLIPLLSFNVVVLKKKKCYKDFLALTTECKCCYY